MTDDWKQWEGRTVEGRFPLQTYLGSSNRSAVFLTRVQIRDGGPEKAAIKLIPASATDAGKQLARWATVRELDHSNLINILDCGRCDIDGQKLLYVVEEYAEENLAQIVPERALTADEVRGMLPPVLSALQGIHDKGFVHGSIGPSNIFAVGDQVKLSRDSLYKAGEKRDGAGTGRETGAYNPPEAASQTSSANDVWQFGMTLVEVLTQRLPDWDRNRNDVPDVGSSIPEPFREIAQGCLRLDPAKRWTVRQIASRVNGGSESIVQQNNAGHTAGSAVASSLPVATKVGIERAGSPSPLPTGSKSSPKWPYFAALAAVGLIGIFLIARPKPAASPTEPPSAQTSSPSTEQGTVPSSGVATESAPVESKGPSASQNALQAGDPGDTPQSDVVKRVVPEVSPSARRTIHGKIQVRVRVNVDASGNVVNARIESGRGSKYFSRLALEAARSWKFRPATTNETGEREWKLQFGFSRTATEAYLVHGKR